MRIALIMAKGGRSLEIMDTFSRKGWNVQLYESVKELLLDDTTSSVPDLVIVELKMAGGQTWRGCHALRSTDISSFCKVPVVLVSHLYSSQYGTTVARSMGVEGYIQLTGNYSDLAEKVDQIHGSDDFVLSSPAVLLVDDDPVLIRMMQNKFETNHWIVDTATTVKSGLDKVAGSRYDIVIIDFYLPDGKGDVVLEEIVHTFPETTTLMITGDTQPGYAIDWLEKGASGYLLKPFSCQFLYETAMRCIRERLWGAVEQEFEEKDRELRERESVVTDFENCMGDVLWRRGLDHHYEYISPSVTQLSGYTSTEFASLSLEEEMSPESAASFKNLIEKAVQAYTPSRERSHQYTIPAELNHKDGPSLTVEYSFTIKADRDGNPVALVGTIKDISDEKKQEEKHLQVQRLEAIGVLAAGIIHDFNNILTPIVGYANLIKMIYADDTVIQDHMTQILLAGNRAKELIQQILAFSRGKEKKQEQVNLTPLIKESMKMIRSFLPSKIQIRHDITGDFPDVLIDPTQFSQLFMNLITNSYHAMEETGGTIDIGLTTHIHGMDDTTVQLRVADSGKGIPLDIMGRVFDPFFTTKGEGKGTGLGLSVCRSIVEEAGGHIEIEYSSEQQGTCLTVTLPAKSERKGSVKNVEREVTRFNGHGKNILLVDDDKIVLDYLSAALERLNFTVESYCDSSKALQAFTNNLGRYFLLFTDIEMPNTDGYQLIGEIRNRDAKIPIIVCTGNDETEVESSIEQLDRLEIIKKPVTVNDVSTVLKKLFFQETMEAIH